MTINVVAPAPRTSAAASAGLELTGRVVDQAELLSAEEEALLTALSADLEKRTKHQFVIATVNGLDGKDIADYARDLGNRWGIGRKGVNDGVLMVVAPKERKLRIAVADGLTKALTDDEAADIIEKRILPDFKEGRMSDGIQKGAEAIVREISE